MTRTFGSDNAIAWVQIRLRGGARTMLSTTATYSAVIILAIIGTVQLLPENPNRVYSGWMLGMMVLQAAVLLLLAPSRVAAAIRQDLTSGIIESNRLMPIAPMQAVIGYIIGSTIQSTCFAVANLVIGGFVANLAGIGPSHWLGVNALLFTFALMIWIVIACASFHQKNAMGLVFVGPGIPAFGQSGALGLLPGIVLLITPLLGGSIFDVSTTLGGLRDIYILSIASQMVVGSLCFVAACRKYRRSDVIGFTPLLGLLLLGTWVAISYFGTMWWEELKPRYVHSPWLKPGAQFLSSLLLGMLLALVPVWAAAEQTVRWVARRLLNDPAVYRRPVRDELIVLLATLILLPLGVGAHVLIRNERPSLVPLILIALTIFIHLITMSFVRRALRFYTAKLNSMMLILLGALWVGPLLADLVRHEMLEDEKAPILTQLSCVSPAGSIVALMNGRENEVTVGVIIQIILAVLAVFFYVRIHPFRRRDLSGVPVHGI